MNTALEKLADKWRFDAKVLRSFGAEVQAIVLERVATELQEALQRSEREPLTIAVAAEESAYSRSHLRRMLREGSVANDRYCVWRRRSRSTGMRINGVGQVLRGFSAKAASSLPR